MILGQNRVIAKIVNNYTFTLIVCVVGRPWPKTCATLFHAQLVFLDKGRVIKELSVIVKMLGEQTYILNYKVVQKWREK